MTTIHFYLQGKKAPDIHYHCTIDGDGRYINKVPISELDEVNVLVTLKEPMMRKHALYAMMKLAIVYKKVKLRFHGFHG